MYARSFVILRPRHVEVKASLPPCDLALANRGGGNLDFGDFLTQKVPEGIRRRILERPEAFRMVAELDDAALDRLVGTLDGGPAKPRV